MDDARRLAILAERAAAEIQPGMRLGLGSGSTAEAVLKALGRRVADGLAVSGVATSSRTERLARELGIPLIELATVDRLDFGFDGADEIDPALHVLKGRGGALLYEKLVALACDRYLIVAAAEKLVERLGTRMPLPIEVVPFGWEQTAARLRSVGCEPTLRTLGGQSGGSQPFLTDGGHYMLDCQIGPIADPPTLAGRIKATTGVVDHGLFVGMANQAMVVDGDGVVLVLTRPD